MGQYEILRELGSGSFGSVYLGRGQVPRKKAGRAKTQLVAIKQLKDASDYDALRQLKAEFELLDQVMHRSLCKVYEFLEDDNAVVMEAVEGVTLRQVVDICAKAHQPVKTEAAIEIGCELADALYQSYSSIGRNGGPLQLVHRDIKPENVMLTPSGEVKILDFGLAKVRERGRRKRERGLKGTPLYMAPEQAAGRTVDHRTDLFSVGLILYELLMNEPAYRIRDAGDGDPVEEVMRRIERADLREEIRELEKRLPGPGPVVSKCLAAAPRARYQNGHELMLDLRRELFRDRGAYLGEFCDYFFHNLHPVQPLDAGIATGTSSAPPSARGVNEPRRAEPMANDKRGGPPRPGGGPPRPGGRRGGPARPGGGARRGPPAAGGPPGPPGRRGPGGPPGRPPGPPGRRGPPGPRPPTPPGRGGAPEEEEEEEDYNAKSGTETGMLSMTPLTGGDDDYDEDAPPKSATQFFAIPKSKKTAKKPKPPGPAPVGIGASGGGRSLPPGAAPPVGGGPPPAPLPGAAPPGRGGAIGGPVAGGVGAPMAISGPIASGPTAGGGTGGERSPFQVGQQPTGEHAAPGQRASSFRIYAIILALFFFCFLAMVSAVLVVVVGSQYSGGDDAEETVKVDKKKKKKKKTEQEDTASEDDGAAAAPPPPPPPPPRRSSGSSTRRSGGGSSGSSGSSAGSSRSRGGSAPPGSIKVTVSGSTFLAVEIKCPAGTRKRAAFSGGTATAQGIPAGQDCELHFKGGAPVKFRPVRAGNAYSCTVQGSTAVCK